MYFLKIAILIENLTDSAPEEDEEKPDWIEDVVWRNPEGKLEVEGVELSDEKPNDEADNGHPPLKTRQRVPSKLNPPMRRKLSKESLYLAPVGWYLI